MIAGMKKIIGRIKQLKEFWDWLELAWRVACALGFAGFVVSVGSTIWALVRGLPGPFISMGAFCTLVAAIYFAMAPLIYRALKQQEASTPRPTPELDYKPIRLQHQYSLGQVSRLWVGSSTGNSYATVESKIWYATLVSAIQQGKLKFEPGNRDRAKYERQNPDANTVLSRVALKDYAQSIGENPPFLRDS
jgi:hypothetical protein